MTEDNFFEVEKHDDKKDKLKKISEDKSSNLSDLIPDIGLNDKEFRIPLDGVSAFFILVECLLVLYAVLGLLGLVPLF